MLIVSNGAYKSGSTWLVHILRGLTGYALPPEPYQRPGWGGLGISPSLLKQFLRQVDYANQNFIFKAHLFYKRHLVINRPHIKTINITRNLPDVLVSAFYYEQMRGPDRWEKFDDFYWDRGKQVAHMVIRYNRFWSDAKNGLAVSYEQLHEDFAGEINRIAEFLQLKITAQDIDRVRSETELNRMRAQYNEVSADGKIQFYRKGIVGDWKSHFSDPMLAELKQIELKYQKFPSWLDLAGNRIKNALVGRTLD